MRGAQQAADLAGLPARQRAAAGADDNGPRLDDDINDPPLSCPDVCVATTPASAPPAARPFRLRDGSRAGISSANSRCTATTSEIRHRRRRCAAPSAARGAASSPAPRRRSRRSPAARAHRARASPRQCALASAWARPSTCVRSAVIVGRELAPAPGLEEAVELLRDDRLGVAPPRSCARRGARRRPSADRRCRPDRRRPACRPPARRRAGRRCRAGQSGRPRRARWTCRNMSAVSTGRWAPVEAITMSAAPSARAGRSSR